MTVAPPLDSDQRRVLAAMLDPSIPRILVESPPGTGKTYAAVACAAAAEQQLLAANQRILILTFSDAARMQLEQYALQLLGSERQWMHWLEITNYHAFFLKYIWANRSRLGLPSDLRIDSPGARKDFLANVLKRVIGSDKGAEAFGAALDLRIPRVSADGLLQTTSGEAITAIQEAILNRNRKQLLGYDDFAFHFWTLIEGDPGLLIILRRKYPLLMLDEYQDVSDAQDELTRLLLGDVGRAVIFADEMQCIHEWRGARADRVERIRRLPESREIALTSFHRYQGAPELRLVLDIARRRLSGGGTDAIPLVPNVVEIRRPGQAQAPCGPLFEARSIADRERKRADVKSVAVICHTRQAVIECRRHFHKYFVFTRPGHVLDVIHDCVAALIEDLQVPVLRSCDEVARFMAAVLEGDEDFEAVRRKPDGAFRCERRLAIAESLRSIDPGRPLAWQLDGLIGAIERLPRCKHQKEINHEVLGVLRRAGRVPCEGQMTSETAGKLTDVLLQSQHVIRGREPKGVFVLNAHQAKGKEFDTVILADPIDPKLRTFGFPHKDLADRRLLYVVLTRAKSRVFVIPHQRSGAFDGLFHEGAPMDD